MDSTPGPWYSMIAPVPPATVKMSATLSITSVGQKVEQSKCFDQRVQVSIRINYTFLYHEFTFWGGPATQFSFEMNTDHLENYSLLLVSH